jgi:hypothetical protein
MLVSFSQIQSGKVKRQQKKYDYQMTMINRNEPVVKDRPDNARSRVGRNKPIGAVPALS